MSTDNAKSRYRKDLSEMPDWLKKKACPHRDKFMSGKRILPGSDYWSDDGAPAGGAPNVARNWKT